MLIIRLFESLNFLRMVILNCNVFGNNARPQLVQCYWFCQERRLTLQPLQVTCKMAAHKKVRSEKQLFGINCIQRIIWHELLVRTQGKKKLAVEGHLKHIMLRKQCHFVFLMTKNYSLWSHILSYLNELKTVTLD